MLEECVHWTWFFPQSPYSGRYTCGTAGAQKSAAKPEPLTGALERALVLKERIQ